MSWFYERLHKKSLGGADIFALRLFGRWSVRFDRAIQTNSYTDTMWTDAFAKIPMHQNMHILVLGLGGGGAIKEVYECFPHSTVTAVEYDPAMIAIAKHASMWAPYKAPAIVEDDAENAIKKMTGTFDLVIVDLFDDVGISPLLRSKLFWAALETRLSNAGVLLVNFASFLDTTKIFIELFPSAKTWHYKQNLLGLYFVSAHQDSNLEPTA